MLNIGCHLSSSKGYVNMLNETEYVGTIKKKGGL